MIFSWDGLDIDRRDCGRFRGQSRGKEVHPVPPVSPGPGPAPWMGLSSCPRVLHPLDIDQFSVTSLDASQHHQESHIIVNQQLRITLMLWWKYKDWCSWREIKVWIIIYNFLLYLTYNVISFCSISTLVQYPGLNLLFCRCWPKPGSRLSHQHQPQLDSSPPPSSSSYHPR